MNSAASGAHDLDLAEGRGVEDTAGIAHRETLARHRRVHVLDARAGNTARASTGPRSRTPRPAPAPSHESASCAPGSNRSPREMPAKLPKVAGVYGMRNVVKPDLRDGRVERLRGDRERVQVRGLALVGRHSGRGVALQVFDRAESLLRGKPQVAHRHVVLKVDEGLELAGRVCGGERAQGGSGPSGRRLDGVAPIRAA